MPELVLHPSVAEAVERYKQRPCHALVLIGEMGAGKGSLIKTMAAQLLDTSEEKVEGHARLLAITSDSKIGIDEIRRIQHFLSLKPADRNQTIRVVTIENAGRMTTEAQNALLKSIEEPPADTYMLLSATSATQLLPTIMSRVQTLTVHKPADDALKNHFGSLGHKSMDIDRAYMMGSGLPGAMAGLLSGDAEHPTLQAADTARQLLQNGKFERLVAIDALAKDRESAIRVCEVLAHMASITLKKDGLAAAQRERWQNVLAASLEAADGLRVNGMAKLILTSMSLKI